MSQTAYTVEGMPQLETQGKTVSVFEFWPTWLMYLPVVFYWLWLALKYRSLSLPLNANPSIPLSGMVGFSKHAVLASATQESQQWILPSLTYTVSGHSDEDLRQLLSAMQAHNFRFPVVGKPDLGCRGAGVCLLEDEHALKAYIQNYPATATMILQQLSSWEPEAGIFYVKHPEASRGKIISLALKYSPYVVGDGTSTLLDLIKADPRASQLTHLYIERHAEYLDQVIEKDQPYRLVFSASHCRGAIFREGEAYITEALTEKLDKILGGLPEFYYGRLDVKFRDIDALMAGETLEIVEINGASSESLHIWDRNASLFQAWQALLLQYKTLFIFGDANRKRGFLPPGLKALYQAWKVERKLVAHYPETD